MILKTLSVLVAITVSSGSVAAAQSDDLHVWLPDEVRVLHAQMHPVDLQIELDLLGPFIARKIEHSRIELDARLPEFRAFDGLVSWNGHGGSLILGVTCSDQIYQVDWVNRAGFSARRSANSDLYYQATRDYTVRLNRILLEREGHPLADICQVSETGHFRDDRDERADMAEMERLLSGGQ